MSKPRKFIVAADLHGDMAEPSAVSALFKFTRLFKPDLRVFAGDLWDFRPLRRGASDDEKHETMKADFKAGMAFVKQWEPTHFLRGNHDERLWELRERDCGVASDYAGELIEQTEKQFKHLRCPMLPYHKRDGVLRLGHLKILHGFHSGLTATRQTALTYGASLIGHIHCIDEHAIPGLDRRVCRAIGALCKLDMDYNARTVLTLRQAHGFAMGLLFDDGSYTVAQCEEIKGRWFVPSNFMEL